MALNDFLHVQRSLSMTNHDCNDQMDSKLGKLKVTAFVCACCSVADVTKTLQTTTIV